MSFEGLKGFRSGIEDTGLLKPNKKTLFLCQNFSISIIVTIN